MNWFLHSFWFHMLIAAVIGLVFWWVGYGLIGLVINVTLWPARELWQKRHHLRDFFSMHVFLEWATPLLVGVLIFYGAP